MIPFPFNENRFSFFVADHFLVGQLCTNPKSDRNLLSCLKVNNVQRARSEMRRCTTHALYWSKLWQQNHCQHPQNANLKRHRLGFRRRATSLYPSLTGPLPLPTWTRWTTSFGHTSRTSPTWPPTTPKPAWSLPSAGACEKGMLPVPDPYRGSDWGWKRLHWIDVSSTT